MPGASLVARFAASMQETVGRGYAPADVQEGSPINERLPQYTAKFLSRYEDPNLGTYNPAAVTAVKKIDQQRILNGQAPLSDAEMQTALKAAQTRVQPIDQERDPTSLFSNAVADASAIGKSIIHIPELLVKEAMALPGLPGELAKAQDFEDITKAPGIRMIPGAYVAGELSRGSEGVKELGRHPLMAALDVLPVASKLAKGSTVVKAAEAENAALAATREARALETGATYVDPPAVRPLKTALLRKVDAESGAVVPNRPGQIIQDAITQTRFGRKLSQTFGADAREASILTAHADRAVENALLGGAAHIPQSLADNPALPAARQVAELMTSRARDVLNLDDATIVRLSDEMQTVATPEWFNGLPDNELAFVTEIRDHGTVFKNVLADEGKLGEFGGEVYDIASQRKLRKRNQEVTKRVAKFQETRLGEDKGMLFTADGTPRPETAGKGSTLRELAEAPGADPRLYELYDHVVNGDYKAGLEVLNKLKRGRTRLGQAGQVGEEAAPAGNISLASLGKMSKELEGIVEAEAKAARAIEKTVPARFAPIIDKKLGEAIQERAIAANPEQAAQITQAVAERRFKDVMPAREVGKLRDEVARTWRELKAAGVDPVFVHHVSPEAATAIRYPKVMVGGVSSIKRRVGDMGPSIQDASVAMTHQGMEILRDAGRKHWEQATIDRWGVRQSEAAAKLEPQARRLMERDPRLDYGTAIQRVLNEEYQVFNPSDFYGGGKVRVGNTPKDPMLIPKSVAKTFEQIAKPMTETIMDVPMKAFRTSVLALSPRWHAYNIVGGALMLQARTGVDVWRYLSEARQIIKNGGLPEEMKLALGGASREIKELNFYGGRTLERLGREARAKSPALDTAATAGEKLVAGSYKLNALFDDTYRVMAYLYGKDKAVTKGLSPIQAEARGLALARKVMVNWDAMTPIERGIIKQIFPFYGFTQHMMKYALSYPVDHPFRMAVVGSFARNEMEDLSGLPDTMANAFFFGDEDAQGNRKSISVGAANPFSDIASLFTLGGYIGGVNPIIGTALRQVGVDPMEGGAELYPDLRFDPTSGLQQAQHGNILMSAIQNTVPQLQAVTAMAGINPEANRLRATNPDAANRMLRSQLGLPVGRRDYNIGEAYARQALKIRTAAADAKNQALKTGDDSYVSQFPQLDAYMRQIRTIQGTNPEALAEMTNPTQTVTRTGRFANALNVAAR